QRREELVRARAMPALLEGLRADEDGAGVGAVRPRRAREAGELHRVVDARRREDDLARAADDRIGARQRGTVGELDGDDEVALVLRRDETGRDDAEANESE